MKRLISIFAMFATSLPVFSYSATQSSYPMKGTPVAGDKALITDSADGNKTKQATVGSLPISTATQNALDGKETKAVVQASAPADTTVDWYDTDQESGVLVLKRHNGTTWVRASSHGVQYASNCAGITAGMCVDTDDGKLYYHNNTSVVEVGTSGESYTLPTASADILGGIKVGSRLSIADGVLSADIQTTDISGKENSLGNPSTNGYVLSSTTSGVRSWIEMTGGGTGIAHAASDGNYYASKDGGWANLLGVFAPPLGADDNYVTDAQISAWNAKQNALVANTDYITPQTAAATYVSLISKLPTVAPTNGRQIIQAVGGCSNTAYDTQATCEANSGTWTTPVGAWSSVIEGLINDTGTADDDLWSAAKITSELATKQNTLVAGTDYLTPANAAATYQLDLSIPDQAEAEAGTATIERAWTAQRIAQAIAALAPSGGGNIILQQSFVSASTLVADTGAKNKLATGVNWTTADIGCDASDTLTVSVKSSSTVNGTYTQIGTITLSGSSYSSGVDISSWANSSSGHWIRIDLSGTPAAAKDCIIAIGGTEL